MVTGFTSFAQDSPKMWHYGAEVASGATSAKFRQSANVAKLPINNKLTQIQDLNIIQLLPNMDQ